MSDRERLGSCPESLLAEAIHVGTLQAVVDCSGQGLSDSLVFDLRWAGERRALKGWPDTSGRAAQLHSTHHVQVAIGRHLNQSTSPKWVRLPSIDCFTEAVCRIPTVHTWSNGQTILACQERLWEWGSWLVGSSRSYESFEQHHFQQAMVAVEQIHAASLALGTDVGASARWERRIELHRQLLSLDRRSARLSAFHEIASACHDVDPAPVLQDLWDCWRQISPQSFGPLVESISRLFPRRWIVGDLWRDHLLFEHNLPCGIIDWGATSWDWPGWDWIRLMTTTPFWNRLEAWRIVAQTLEEQSAHGPWHRHYSLEEKIVRLAELGRFQLYLTAGQWILWAGLPRQQNVLFQPKSHRRLTELLTQMQTWRQ
jgi:hypothetical protein